MSGVPVRATLHVGSSALFHAAVLGPILRSKGRSALLVLAIALGVALGLAIYLINRSAAEEVALASRSLYGLADLTVESAQGFDEALYPRIARIPGVEVASPVVEVEAELVGTRRALTLLGIDAFRSRLLQPAFASLTGSAAGEAFTLLDPDAIVLSASAARDLGLSKGDLVGVQIGVEKVTFRVSGVLPPQALQDRAAVIDIAEAQERFGRLGVLSRINIRLESGASTARVRAAIEVLLPPGARVTTPGEANDEALRLSRSYRANLTALALVALFTGGFFVYSTQSLAALRRRREFAILHALGVTRRQQLALALSGSLIVGLAGSLLGVVLGVAAAVFGLRAVGLDLGAGYFRGLDAELQVHPIEIIVFVALGVLVAGAGALRPAIEAARVPTANALKAGDVASGVLRTHWKLVGVLLLLAGAILFVPPIDGLPLPGYLSIALLLIGVVAAMPGIVRWTLKHAPRLRSTPYQVAIAQISGTARYATLSVSATIVSFSLMVSMAIMVTSFRESLDAWTHKLLPADLYVRAGYVGQSSHFTEQQVAAIRALPGVERVEVSRFARVPISSTGPAATLIARTLQPDRIADSLWLTSSTDERAPSGALPVWVSEATADLAGLRAGETFEFSLAGRRLSAFVRGVWRDYEHQNGAVLIDRATYVKLTGDRAVNTISIWLREGVQLPVMQQTVRELLPTDIDYDLRTPGDIRRRSLAAFDRTFAVTYLLELVAILIGLFGIASGISAQVLARRAEFGALRHIGFTRGQIARMLAIEGGVLGAIGVLVGLATGAWVSLILIYVINRQSFHWSMDVFVPTGLLLGLATVLIAAASLIAVASGRQAMSADVIRAVKEDW